MDYAALGLAVLASDVPAYRGSVADGTGGRLVANTESGWFIALCDLIRDAAERQRLAGAGAAALVARDTLAAQAEARRAAWRAVVADRSAAGRARKPTTRLAAD
jgi:glycosyltransferase involved in cell wall biosynthesis